MPVYYWPRMWILNDPCHSASNNDIRISTTTIYRCDLEHFLSSQMHRCKSHKIREKMLVFCACRVPYPSRTISPSQTNGLSISGSGVAWIKSANSGFGKSVAVRCYTPLVILKYLWKVTCSSTDETLSPFQPLFLFLALQAPHTPIQVPQEYSDLYNGIIFNPLLRNYAGNICCEYYSVL